MSRQRPRNYVSEVDFALGMGSPGDYERLKRVLRKLARDVVQTTADKYGVLIAKDEAVKIAKTVIP